MMSSTTTTALRRRVRSSVEIDHNSPGQIYLYVWEVIYGQEQGFDYCELIEAAAGCNIYTTSALSDFANYSQQIRRSKRKSYSQSNTNSGSQRQRGRSAQSYTPSPGVILTHRDQRTARFMMSSTTPTALQRRVRSSVPAISRWMWSSACLRLKPPPPRRKAGWIHGESFRRITGGRRMSKGLTLIPKRMCWQRWNRRSETAAEV